MGKPFLDTVRQYYSDALAAEDIVSRLLGVIEGRFDLKPHQLLQADSLCCDEVCLVPYPAGTGRMLGPFRLGGLCGFPFAGLTGMAALANHVPDDGSVVIFHGPHIGLTRDGRIGEINRPGQSSNTLCCGALTAGLSKLLQDNIEVGSASEVDAQMNTLEQILLRSKKRIRAGESRIIAATEVIYEAIEERIDSLLSKTAFPCRYIFQIGAVLINGDQDIGPFCSCRRCEVVDTSDSSRLDLRQALFS